jgi:general secretion pathway protein A
MYQSFYDLQEMPFELTPDPKYLYLSRQHREALSNLEYGLLSSKGITVLTGEAGTGKTTLLHAMLGAHQCRHVNSVFISNPTLTRAEFVEMLSQRFRLSGRAAESKAALLAQLDTLLRERRAAGQLTALVIDEAQSLSPELLEEVRLLANSETATEKLLPLVLVGQPELRDRLNEPGLRQLKQRITLRCEITPFNLAETTDYIASRVRTAGGDAARLFTRDAVTLIFERSGGIPRTISVLCDNALLTGCGLGQRPVTRAIVLEVARDFDIGGSVTRHDLPPDPTSYGYRAPQPPPFEYPPPSGDRGPSRMAQTAPPLAVSARIAVAEPLTKPPEPLPADKVLAFLSDRFWWSLNKLRTAHKWVMNRRRGQTPHPMRPTALVDSRYVAVEVPFRGSPDESR